MKVVIDQGALDRLKRESGAAAASKAAVTARDRVRANIRAKGRVDTGAMAGSITHRKIEDTPDRQVFSIGSSLDYTRYQEEGIGPVQAGRGRVLAFRPKGSSVVIFRPRTRGFPGAHFFRDALRSLGARDFTR